MDRGDSHNVKVGIELLPWHFTRLVIIWFTLLNIWFILITLHDIIIFFNFLFSSRSFNFTVPVVLQNSNLWHCQVEHQSNIVAQTYLKNFLLTLMTFKHQNKSSNSSSHWEKNLVSNWKNQFYTQSEPMCYPDVYRKWDNVPL